MPQPHKEQTAFVAPSPLLVVVSAETTKQAPVALAALVVAVLVDKTDRALGVLELLTRDTAVVLDQQTSTIQEVERAAVLVVVEVLLLVVVAVMAVLDLQTRLLAAA